jgi:hypothetical protein
MFNLIFEVVESAAPNFQVIITDHADLNEPDFKDSVIAGWRGKEELIPQD